jgi:tetratricopeptide (TPR) repeat protein
MDKHVFISYQHDDGEFAENLIHAVEKNGFKTWIDSDRLNPGEDWREGIDQAIRDAFALIVIMSPTAKASEYVTYEWAFAWGCGLKVIPVMYRKTELHPRLESLQYMDFTNRSIRPWDSLMKVLQKAASEPLLPPVPVVPETSTEQKGQEWINKGETFLKRKDYEEALDAFRQAILLDQDSAQAYAGKCVALYRLKRYQEALSASRQALRFDVNMVLVWNIKGAILRHLNKLEEALAAYDEALHLAPNDAATWSNKGSSLVALGRFSEALTVYDKTLHLAPNDADTWFAKSVVLNKLERFQEAAQCFKKARELGYKEDEEV